MKEIKKDLKNGELHHVHGLGTSIRLTHCILPIDFNSVSIKISRYFVFFNKIDYLDSKYIWKDKEFEAARTILKNTNNF